MVCNCEYCYGDMLLMPSGGKGDEAILIHPLWAFGLPKTTDWVIVGSPITWFRYLLGWAGQIVRPLNDWYGLCSHFDSSPLGRILGMCMGA